MFTFLTKGHSRSFRGQQGHLPYALITPYPLITDCVLLPGRRRRLCGRCPPWRAPAGCPPARCRARDTASSRTRTLSGCRTGPTATWSFRTAFCSLDFNGHLNWHPWFHFDAYLKKNNIVFNMYYECCIYVVYMYNEQKIYFCLFQNI